jgi:hypothetical protein
MKDSSDFFRLKESTEKGQILRLTALFYLKRNAVGFTPSEGPP